MFDLGDFEVEFGDEIFCHYAKKGEPCWGGVCFRNQEGEPSKEGESQIPTCAGHTPAIWGAPYVPDRHLSAPLLMGGHLRLFFPKDFEDVTPRDPEVDSLEAVWDFNRNGVTEADVDLEEVERMVAR